MSLQNSNVTHIGGGGGGRVSCAQCGARPSERNERKGQNWTDTEKKWKELERTFIMMKKMRMMRMDRNDENDDDDNDDDNDETDCQ